MRALLERWHRIEPTRCLLKSPMKHICAWVALGERHESVYFTTPSADEMACLLAAVIEAVTARGWYWSVGNNIQGPYRSQIDTLRRGFVERADTPAEALLTAYLAALEAEQ